jgi:hypothetical protein
MIILKDVPPTFDWGWFSREDPRMHLQPVDREHRRLGYKVWLERDGRRVLEPEPGIPTKVWKPLQSQIVKRRGMIEAFWTSFMIRHGWLDLHVTGSMVTIVAYPGYPHRFTRRLDLRDVFGNPETLAKITPEEVALNEEYACLVIFPTEIEARQDHIDLTEILWTDGNR